MKKFSTEGTRRAFEELGFRSLIKRLLSGQNNPNGEQVKKKEENISEQMELL